MAHSDSAYLCMLNPYQVSAHARPAQRHDGKLSSLEGLLWGERTHAAATGWKERLLQLLRFIIALALRNLSVVVTDAEFQYQQMGDPGPVIISSNADILDTISVTIRIIEVSPLPSSLDESQAAAEPGQPASTFSGSAEAECSDVPTGR